MNTVNYQLAAQMPQNVYYVNSPSSNNSNSNNNINSNSSINNSNNNTTNNNVSKQYISPAQPAHQHQQLASTHQLQSPYNSYYYPPAENPPNQFYPSQQQQQPSASNYPINRPYSYATSMPQNPSPPLTNHPSNSDFGIANYISQPKVPFSATPYHTQQQQQPPSSQQEFVPNQTELNNGSFAPNNSGSGKNSVGSISSIPQQPVLVRDTTASSISISAPGYPPVTYGTATGTTGSFAQSQTPLPAARPAFPEGLSVSSTSQSSNVIYPPQQVSTPPSKPLYYYQNPHQHNPTTSSNTYEGLPPNAQINHHPHEEANPNSYNYQPQPTPTYYQQQHNYHPQQTPNSYFPAPLPAPAPAPAIAIPQYPHSQLQQTHSSQSSIPSLHGYKRSYSEYDSFESRKSSSIAGVVYNSTAVFKRLKPSSLDEDIKESGLKEETTRSQGRPFSSNVSGRFILHENLKSLLNQVDKKNNNKFVVYDMQKNKERYLKNNDDEKKIDATNGTTPTNKNTEKLLRNNKGIQIQQLLFKNLKENFGMYNPENDVLSSNQFNNNISISSLDNFIRTDHDDVLSIDGYRDKYYPTQKKISYNPKTHNLESGDKTFATAKFNFHQLIKENFGIDKYVFIKTIRDNNGHILKLETIKPPAGCDGKYEYSAEWLKKKICYPRYKGGMNLHLLGADSNFILYNDLKMLIWDIKEEILSRNDTELLKVLSSNGSDIINEELKFKLFGDKKIYIHTVDS